MLVKVQELIQDAVKNNYALGAFNTSNLEMTQGIVEGAIQQNAPIIVQVSETTIKYAGLKTIMGIVHSIAQDELVKVPIGLHLDHGRNFHSIIECINAGFSSVQIDASYLGLEENIMLTKQIADFAHKKSVIVQGEVDRIPGTHGEHEEYDEKTFKENYKYSNPKDVKRFVEETGVDTVAVAVGTTHGLLKDYINFKVLKSIYHLVKTPLVLHGASSIAALEVRRVTKYGVREINIDTELRRVFIQALKRALKEKPDIADPREVLTFGKNAVREVVAEKVVAFGSANRA